jgi:putative hydrolase of the HAD superfamily
MPIDKQPIQSPSHRYIRCLLFDLGSTLWDRRRDRAAEAESNRHIGEILRQQQLSERIAAGDDEQTGAAFHTRFREAKRKRLQQQQPTIELDGPQLVQDTLRQWRNEKVADSVAVALFHALQVRLTSPSHLFDDTIPTLAALQARMYRLGIVANRLWGGSGFFDDLRQIGLLRYFDPRAIAISADVGVRKPHPDLYLRSCAILDTAPTEAAMIGNSLYADVLGSQRLGMLTIWKPRPEQWERIKAHQAGHEQPLTTPGIPAEEQQARVDSDFLPARSQRGDEYLERYLRGEIMPDMVIERLADLLNAFVDAQAPCIWEK